MISLFICLLIGSKSEVEKSYLGSARLWTFENTDNTNEHQTQSINRDSY